MDYVLTVFTLFASFLGAGLGYVDGHLISQGYPVEKRTKRIRTRVTSSIFVIISMFVFSYFRDSSIDSYLSLFRAMWYVTIHETLNVAILAITAQLGAYWIMFDLAVNKTSGKPLLYTSYKSGDENRVLSDKLFDLFPERFAGLIQLIVKVLILVFGLYYTITVL